MKKSVFRLARLYMAKCSCWAIALKAAWENIKKWGNKAFALWNALMERTAGRPRMSNFPTDYMNERPVRYGTMKVRAKYARRIKNQKKADFMQSFL